MTQSVLVSLVSLVHDAVGQCVSSQTFKRLNVTSVVESSVIDQVLSDQFVLNIHILIFMVCF